MTAPRPMLTVAEAEARLLGLAEPVGEETVSLLEAEGRVLRRAVAARRTQPPFDAAQMDGYALGLSGETAAGTRFTLVAEARAGAAAERALGPGEAARIFTGAPMPAAAGGALLGLALQEDAELLDGGGAVRFSQAVSPGRWIRPAGLDFTEGQVLLDAPRRLTAEDVALAAAAGAPLLTVARRPRVALLTLGDELRLPGEPLGPAEIYASNQFGVGALLARAGAEVSTAPVVPDDLDALTGAIQGAGEADLLVTLGGASEGDHDLARPAFAALGMAPDFYKVAMRPGKPLMAGRLGRTMVVGLPGNPVSAMVCARIFLIPALRALTGAPAREDGWLDLPLACDLGPGGERAHYMRARLEGPAGARRARPFEDQDSSRLSLLAQADCLMLRPVGDPPRLAGETVPCLPLKS